MKNFVAVCLVGLCSAAEPADLIVHKAKVVTVDLKVPPAFRYVLGMRMQMGAVMAVRPPAKDLIFPEDLILAVDGQTVEDPNAFDYRFATKPLGGAAQLGVLRGGREAKIPIALETAPDSRRDEMVIRSRSPFLGAKVANLSPALADELRIDATGEGVAIVDAPEGSVAAIMLGEPRGSRFRIADPGRAPRAPDEAPARRRAASRGRS